MDKVRVEREGEKVWEGCWDWEHRLIPTLGKRRGRMLGKEESVGGWRGAGVLPELRLGV